MLLFIFIFLILACLLVIAVDLKALLRIVSRIQRQLVWTMRIDDGILEKQIKRIWEIPESPWEESTERGSLGECRDVAVRFKSHYRVRVAGLASAVLGPYEEYRALCDTVKLRYRQQGLSDNEIHDHLNKIEARYFDGDSKPTEWFQKQIDDWTKSHPTIVLTSRGEVDGSLHKESDDQSDSTN